MIIEQIKTDHDLTPLLKKMQIEGAALKILAAKHQHYLIHIKALHVGAANILKQDALSIGADLAVPKGTIIAATPQVDALLIATRKQLQQLSKKELAQPFGLKEVAQRFSQILKAKKTAHCEVMGVINANDDSFFSQSRFKADAALLKIEKMIADGATIIDIGAVSSRPGAQKVAVSEELARLRPIVELLSESDLLSKARFSIDTFEPEVAAYALEQGFHIVNDISGLRDDRMCEVVAKYHAAVIIMHMQGTPQTMQADPHYENLLSEVYDFFDTQIKKAEAYGIEEIILDVGIGFGKRLEDNLSLIQNLEHFLPLRKKLLVGASRKSLINEIHPSETTQRLSGTLALHLAAAQNGAAIIRVHDVYEHVQALKVQETLLQINC